MLFFLYFYSFFLLCLTTSSELLEDYQVVRISDGDGLVVWKTQGSEQIKIRLMCIDAPELDQPYGYESKQFLSSLVPIGSQIKIRSYGKDKYGRLLAKVYRSVASNKLMDVNLELVKNGLAFVYCYFLKNCERSVLFESENLARDKCSNIWSVGPDGMLRPWNFRAIKRGKNLFEDSCPKKATPWECKPIQTTLDDIDAPPEEEMLPNLEQSNHFFFGVVVGFMLCACMVALKNPATNVIKELSTRVKTEKSPLFNLNSSGNSHVLLGSASSDEI